MKYTDQQMDAAESLLESNATEAYCWLLPYLSSRGKDPLDKVASALGVLAVAAGACKAAGIDDANFRRMADMMWNRTVVVTPEEFLARHTRADADPDKTC